MAQEPVVIPEKIYFKIGEVCELVGVQAHVLRYWETEFPTLSPQKNKSGQRSYRRRDVEIALRIKQLLYNEMFTIAGAKKKLQTEQRDGSKSKSSDRSQTQASSSRIKAPTLFDTGFGASDPPRDVVSETNDSQTYSSEQKDVLKTVAAHLLEIREMLSANRTQ
ncbi:MAG: MerR family transcriptional regulator [Pyrinomonadaceae bacterium]